MSDDNRFASVDEIGLGDEVWAYARGWWRRALVVMDGSRRVTVAFTLVSLNARVGAFRLQALPLGRLRRRKPSSSRALDVAPPSLARVGLLKSRGMANVACLLGLAVCCVSAAVAMTLVIGFAAWLGPQRFVAALSVLAGLGLIVAALAQLLASKGALK